MVVVENMFTPRKAHLAPVAKLRHGTYGDTQTRYRTTDQTTTTTTPPAAGTVADLPSAGRATRHTLVFRSRAVSVCTKRAVRAAHAVRQVARLVSKTRCRTWYWFNS